MSSQNAYHEGSKTERMLEKMKDNPFVPVGIAGMVGMVGYGAYNYKNRGSMSTSVYLMSLRVRAQGMVVGAMTIGIGYSLAKEYLFNKDEEAEKS